ncbi:zinc finger protein [Elysia marginata]|uniref:Zinc finger protein n=1 Tax=Elysia marginata TaxID=1093978 RepID=A0AAV4HAQ3_9GAST|nr:zinc finger protein [Elysia marginata]
MIRPSADTRERNALNSSSVSSPGQRVLTTPNSPHPSSPVFPFCLPNDNLPEQHFSGVRKHPMDFLGYTNPRFCFSAMHTEQDQKEMTQRTEEMPNLSGWPTVVDSRIPFTTYLQNLTRTLRMAAAKGVTSSPDNENAPSSLLSVSSNNHCASASPPSSNDVTSCPRSLSCGSQAEPDSSCCGDDRNDSDPKQNDCHDVDNSSEIENSDTGPGADAKSEQKQLKTQKLSLSGDTGIDNMCFEDQTIYRHSKRVSENQSQLAKNLHGLVIPLAQHTFTESNCRGSLSAPVVPYSPIPTSPLTSLSASLPYHFRPHQHPVLEQSVCALEYHRDLSPHKQRQLVASSCGSGGSETNSMLTSSLPASLLHYHLQGQHQHHHLQHPGGRAPHGTDTEQGGRLFHEAALFEPLSSNVSGAGITKHHSPDAMFTKMLLDARTQPGTSLVTSESTPGMPLSGSRSFSISGQHTLGFRIKYHWNFHKKSSGSFDENSFQIEYKYCRIHTGDKPFKCEVCGRAFRQPGNLTRHRLTHTTHKPYVCQVCNKAFNRASNLNTHIRTHTSFRQFPCSPGAKTFQQKADPAVHVFAHAGEPRGFLH